MITIGCPLLGSISAKVIVERRADSSQTTKRRIKNSAAGSGSLFPMISIRFSARLTNEPVPFVLLSFTVIPFPGIHLFLHMYVKAIVRLWFVLITIMVKRRSVFYLNVLRC